MLGFLASIYAAKNQAKQYSLNAAQADLKASYTRKLAKQDAESIRRAAAKNMDVRAENLRRAQENKRTQLSHTKASQAGAGFDMNTGTAKNTLRAAQDALDMEIANMAREADIAYANMYQKSIDTEKQGEIQAIGYEGEAAANRAAAKETKRGIVLQVAGAAIGAIANSYQAMSNNRAVYKQLDEQLQQGTISQADAQSYWENHRTNTFAAFAQGADYGSSYGSLFNPFTSALNSDNNNRKNNYGWLASILKGNVPYRIKDAESPYGFRY